MNRALVLASTHFHLGRFGQKVPSRNGTRQLRLRHKAEGEIAVEALIVKFSL
jgi:hypothetical protein